MTIEDPPIRVGTAADWPDIYENLRIAFHNTPDEAARDLEAGVHEPERSLLIHDGDLLVAHAGSYPRELTVPGAVLPAAHVTLVSVAATHRRRGMLTRLMHRQLRDIRAAGREPIAVLWASEPPIYSRYGYGLASQRLSLRIDNTQVGLPGVPGGPARLRGGPADRFRDELGGLFDRLRPARPGWSSRDGRWWDQILSDLPSQRDGHTELWAVLHEGPTGVDGYALFRTRSAWRDTAPEGEVRVQELVSANAEARWALWHHLLTMDLTRTVTYSMASVDEPLQHLAVDHRRLGTRLVDGLWVRIIDLPAALTGRRYAAPVRVVFEVTDPLLPENAGRWRLTVDAATTVDIAGAPVPGSEPSGVRCERTTEPADLALDIRDLASVLLGGPTLAALAAAGRVRELRPGAVAEASTAFGWYHAPVSIEIF